MLTRTTISGRSVGYRVQQSLTSRWVRGGKAAERHSRQAQKSLQPIPHILWLIEEAFTPQDEDLGSREQMLPDIEL